MEISYPVASAITLLVTFILCRLSIYVKSTPNTFLRNKYQWDIHHIHLGIILLIGVFFLSWNGLNLTLVITGSAAVALILDEFFAFIVSVPYFKRKEWYPTIVLFALLSVILLVMS